MFLCKYKTFSERITYSCEQLSPKVFGCIIINLGLILCRRKVSRGHRPSISRSLPSVRLISSNLAGHDYEVYETLYLNCTRLSENDPRPILL